MYIVFYNFPGRLFLSAISHKKYAAPSCLMRKYTAVKYTAIYFHPPPAKIPKLPAAIYSDMIPLYTAIADSFVEILQRLRPETQLFHCMSSTRGVASGNILCSSLGRRERCLSSSSMQDFHLESMRLMVSRSGQPRSTGIFLSYIVVLFYGAKVAIISNCGGIGRKFSVYEKFFGTCAGWQYDIPLQQSIK